MAEHSADKVAKTSVALKVARMKKFLEEQVQADKPLSFDEFKSSETDVDTLNACWKDECGLVIEATFASATV